LAARAAGNKGAYDYDAYYGRYVYINVCWQSWIETVSLCFI
jgi:hypothetical protein